MVSLKDRVRKLLNRKKKGGQQPVSAQQPTPAAGEPAAPKAAPVASTPAEAATTTTPTTAVPAADTDAAPSQADGAGETQQIPILAEPISRHKHLLPQVKVAATTSGQLQIALQNQSNTDQIWAYITGQAIDNNYALFLLQADGRTPYYPASPSTTGVSIASDIAIPLGQPGSTNVVTIPRIAGGRIWFSQGQKLSFFVNPGPGLVEPSVFNPADPNHGINFSFCEFTFNAYELFVNISYVDFVSNTPIAMTLLGSDSSVQHVSGMPANGLQQVAQGLRDQSARDGQPWSSLIVQQNGQDLRVLSPNSGNVVSPGLFSSYWNDYVNQVYAQYASQPLIVNTQAGYGNVSGTVNGSGVLDFGNGATFTKPSSGDIFSNSTGSLSTGQNGEVNVIVPRLAAAYNRSVLLLSNQTPNGTQPSQYYQNATTNHYSRIVHNANLDGLGYAFPYDDVVPDGGSSQAGVLSTGAPFLLVLEVGGNNSYK